MRDLRTVRLALAVVAVCLPAGLTAETPLKPEKIVEQYVTAMGGARMLARIQAQSIAGNLTEISTGRTGSYSLITKAPNRFYLEQLIEPDHEVTAYNGMSAWAQNPADGVRTLTGPASREAEGSGRYWNGRLLDAKKDKETLQWIGSERVRGRDAYHLRVVLAQKVSRDVFFDTKTHLILREGTGEEQFDYDDYRPVNGIQTPHRIELRRGGRVYSITVTRAEYNAPVDDSVFAFPRTGGAPIPDISTLLIQVNKNQKALEEMQKEYTCHLTSEEDQSDPDGKTKSIKEFEVFHVAGEEVRRLLAKDGKSLEATEKKKEDERFNKEFDKLNKKQAELAADPKKQKQQQDKGEAELSKFLLNWRFANARREKLRGQDVIAVDFGPNPDHKPSGLNENFAHSLAGVMWIDEKAIQVVRVEAHLADSMKIGAGVLASVEKGSNLVMEQAKVNDEVWLPVYVEIHLSGRFLLFKAHANQVDRYSDYRKFRTDTRILSADPN
jgi:hypothetical protein